MVGMDTVNYVVRCQKGRFIRERENLKPKQCILKGLKSKKIKKQKILQANKKFQTRNSVYFSNQGEREL